MLSEHLLNHTARVYKTVSSGGSLSYAVDPAFEWPCFVYAADRAARVQATGGFLHIDWIALGNVPSNGDEIANGDKLILEDGATFYVASVGPWDCPQGEFLELAVTRGT